MTIEHKWIHSVAVTLLLGLGLAPPAHAGGGGAVTGTISFGGKVAKAAELPVTKDHDVCGKSKPSEELIMGKGGGLRNAVVSLEGVTGGAEPAPATVVLDQKGCAYVPHVLAATKGSTLELRSSDAAMHNVHGKHDTGRMLFNVGMPVGTKPVGKKLRRAGLSTITCDAGHTWMKAYVHVFEHPYYAVTGTDGTFEIRDVPPGTYQLVVWHEKLGTKKAKVTVAEGAGSAVSIRYE